MREGSPPAAADQASRLFRFEIDFAGDLRCLPMAVRRKLDLSGVKLKLTQWHGLTAEERQRLLAWPDDASALTALRHWLLERSQSLPRGPATAMPPARGTDWQCADTWPESVATACRELGLTLRPGGWGGLDELQRFALVKLSHPGHEHRNLPGALEEFALLAKDL
ncbi:MAG: hypothetical protein RLZZ117_2794 [Cyanobacteriota bacterium]|jgi:hypothetical protein